MLSRTIIKEQPARRWLKYSAALALLVATLTIAGLALAVHELTFQLDGDTSIARGTTPTAGQTLDWDDLFSATGVPTSLINPNNSTGFTAGAFVRDFGVKVSQADNCSLTNTTSTTFCTADTTTFATGSKDTLNITPGWQCNKDNNVNSKIDIMNAYAASYKAANGDKIIYFGLDKNKDNGNNNVGFWFLQGNANCVAGSGSAAFTGNHSNGDVLVVSAFTSGGGVSNITAYRWAGGANGCIDSGGDATRCDGLSFGEGGDCKISDSGGDSICATTNSGPSIFNGNITTKWLTSDATLGVGKTVVPPNFFEGGINITKIFKDSGSTAPNCFNTFIGDTRSSQSLTATLFDFARGQLGECSATAVTHIHSGSSSDPAHSTTDIQGTTVPVGTVVHDSVVVTGTSSGGTTPAPTGNVTFSRYTTIDCTGTAAATQTVALTTGAGGVSSAESSNFTTTAGVLSYKAVYAGDTNYTNGATAACEPLTVGSTTAATTIHAGSNSVAGHSTTDIQGTTVAAGSVVHDNVVVSGSVTGVAPTGNVTFTRYTTIGCTGTGVDDVKALAQVGTTSNSSAESSDFTTVAGFLSYKAVYAGDSHYSGSTAACEPLTVGSTTAATTIHAGSRSVAGHSTTDIQGTTIPSGSVVHDNVVVSGSVSGVAPTGNVTFTRYTTIDCSGTGVDDVKALAQVGTTSNSSAESSDFTTVAGVMSYKAVYGGDSHYSGSTAACEPLTVGSTTAATTIHAGSNSVAGHSTTDIQGTTVTAGSVVHDNVVVSGSITGVAPTGNVTFTRYTSIGCTGTGVDDVKALAQVGTTSNSSAESSDFTTVAGFLSYKAVYGGDSHYSGSTAACEPLTAITPSTILDKKASVSATVTYAYQEKNDGTVPLTMPAGGYVVDDTCSPVKIVGDTDGDNIHDTGEVWSGDTDNNGILGAGETWDFTCTRTITSAGTYTNIATGHGIDPLGLDVTYCTSPQSGSRCDLDERDTVQIVLTIDNGADRLFKP